MALFNSNGFSMDAYLKQFHILIKLSFNYHDGNFILWKCISLVYTSWVLTTRWDFSALPFPFLGRLLTGFVSSMTRLKYQMVCSQPFLGNVLVLFPFVFSLPRTAQPVDEMLNAENAYEKVDLPYRVSGE